MTITKGTVVTQPERFDDFLAFRLQTDDRTLTVIRTEPKDQKLDILFLCIGQQLILWGREKEGCLLANRIRIFSCAERNYLLQNKENGVFPNGNQAYPGTEPGNREF